MFTSLHKILVNLAILTAIALPSTAMAQNMFATIAKINDTAITQYEFSQRVRLMKALNAPGNLKELAIEKLIDERLQVGAAERAGIFITSEELTAGVEEFAARADMTGDQFLRSIAAKGVAPETFRDFVKSGLVWRTFMRQKFGTKSQISDPEVDRAVANIGTVGSARVLISELFLPAHTPEAQAESERLIPQLTRIRSLSGFASAAREYSVGPSRDRGGRVPNWVPLENLPPPVRALLLTMKVGEVTDPLPLPKAFVLFQLRAIEEIEATALENPTLEYAAYYLPGGLSEDGIAAATKLRAEVDTCDDLFGIAENQPPEVLDHDTLPLSDIPTDVALELAKLDAGEVSTALTRANGQTLVFLMLCSRGADERENASRDAVLQSLFTGRLASYANGYLAELRASATIIRP